MRKPQFSEHKILKILNEAEGGASVINVTQTLRLHSRSA